MVHSDLFWWKIKQQRIEGESGKRLQALEQGIFYEYWLKPNRISSSVELIILFLKHSKLSESTWNSHNRVTFEYPIGWRKEFWIVIHWNQIIWRKVLSSFVDDVSLELVIDQFFLKQSYSLWISVWHPFRNVNSYFANKENSWLFMFRHYQSNSMACHLEYARNCEWLVGNVSCDIPFRQSLFSTNLWFLTLIISVSLIST
jgi:hypothetical protein